MAVEIRSQRWASAWGACNITSTDAFGDFAFAGMCQDAQHACAAVGEMAPAMSCSEAGTGHKEVLNVRLPSQSSK